MGDASRSDWYGGELVVRTLVSGLLCAVALIFQASVSVAAPPNHPRLSALGLIGFDHACGVAVDLDGNLYVSSAGDESIHVFDSSHLEIGTISVGNEPCGIAVNQEGEVFALERATGKVVRFKPDAYPFLGTATYGAAESIVESGQANGLALDARDGRLYVVEGTRVAVFDAGGEAELVDEVQSVTVSEGATGTYTLTFEGETTGPIAANTDAQGAQKALEALPAIGAGNVNVVLDGIQFQVTFVGDLAATDVPRLEGNDEGLSSGELFFVSRSEGFNGYIGEGELEGATGVAAYTYASGDRYVYVADSAGAAADHVDVFGGVDFSQMRLHREIFGPSPTESFGFGSGGAYLAVDPGNEGPGEKCAEEAGLQACTSGHVLVYDDAQHAVEELDASGEYLDRFSDPELADAKPTAIAIDRSAGPGNGTIYVSSGAGAGAGVLAFGPLAPPSRAPLGPPLSRVLKTANLVATDAAGYTYVRAGAEIRVFDPAGTDLNVHLADPSAPRKLAVDSTGKVYVMDRNNGFPGEAEVTYYSPDSYPPLSGTNYVRHAPSIVTDANLLEEPETLGINPSNDHLLVISDTGQRTIELDAAAKGSGFIRFFAPGQSFNVHPSTIGVYGANGNVYVGERPGFISVVSPSGERLARINGAGSPTGKFGTGPIFAVDQSNGHILEIDESSAALREFDASGAFVMETSELNLAGFNDVSIDNSCALHRNAAGDAEPLNEVTTPSCGQLHPSNGRAYAVTSAAVTPQHPFNFNAFGPLEYGGPPVVSTGSVVEVKNEEAILRGVVDPRGVELLECQFDYTTASTFEASGFVGAATAACVPGAEEIGSGNGSAPVSAHISGLVSGEAYAFRLRAKNKYASSEGDPVIFGPPVVTDEQPRPVLYTEATARALINPSGLSTKYFVEYGEAAGEYTSKSATQQLAANAGSTKVEIVIAGLKEGTEYHFRVVAENDSSITTGLDQSFTTQVRSESSECGNAEYRTGLSANLPDCRAYELVTQAETNGLSPGAAGLLTIGSGEAGFSNWLAAPTGPRGGERISYYTQGTLPGFNGNGFSDGYRAERGAGQHPQGGWSSTLFAPTYAESAPDFFHVPSQVSVSSDQLYSFWVVNPSQDLGETLESGAYIGTPGEAAGSPCNLVPQQSDFEVVGCGSLGTDPAAESRYGSPGGAHVTFVSDNHLEPGAAPAGTMAVYDRSVGSNAAQVVSLKPDGSSFSAGQAARYIASSEDGSSIVFSAAGSLFLWRDGTQTVRIAEGTSTFAGISEDGTRVFYAKTANGSEPAALFACDVDVAACTGSEPAGLTEISPAATFVGVSPDAAVAFYATEDHELFSWSAETHEATFVAQLDSSDFENKAFAGISNMNLAAWTTAINRGPLMGRAYVPVRFTPDGSVVLFQSHARLTAYDNSGIGEIYRYDSSAPEGARILCVSCDPGEGPAGADALLQDIGPSSEVRAHTMISNLTDGGTQAFFQSRDRLLPGDANDAEDVYEWTAQGAGIPACKRPGGCLALISSGQGESDSLLFGMSFDGRDVFIQTSEKLVAADVPGSPSIYDARIEGGIPDPPVEQVCTGEACQGSGAPSPVLPSAATTGAGEGKTKTRPAACPKNRHRVKGRCVKKHRKTRAKHQAHHKRRSER